MAVSSTTQPCRCRGLGRRPPAARGDEMSQVLEEQGAGLFGSPMYTWLHEFLLVYRNPLKVHWESTNPGVRNILYLLSGVTCRILPAFKAVLRQFQYGSPSSLEVQLTGFAPRCLIRVVKRAAGRVLRGVTGTTSRSRGLKNRRGRRLASQ